MGNATHRDPFGEPVGGLIYQGLSEKDEGGLRKWSVSLCEGNLEGGLFYWGIWSTCKTKLWKREISLHTGTIGKMVRGVGVGGGRLPETLEV